jgi:squalene cyclase
MNAMKGPQTPSQVEWNTLAVTALQGEAWAAWNASYTAPEREAYRTVSMALYRQDVHERIERLLERSDEQNHRLDTLLQLCA